MLRTIALLPWGDRAFFRERGDVQAAGRGVAGKGEHHHADQGTVPRLHHGVRFDGVRQLASLLGCELGRLALVELTRQESLSSSMLDIVETDAAPLKRDRFESRST